MPASAYASRAASVDGGVMSVSSMPDERRRLAEHAARAGASAARADASVTRRRSPRCSTTRGRALVGRAQHPEVQRLAHDARREHLLGRHLLAEHRVRVVHAVAPVLHDDLGEVVLGEPGFAQQPLGAQREVRGRRGEAGLLAPRLEERRADDALGHLLDAEHEHAVVLAGADRAGRELQRGAAARAAGLDVDDRHAGARERAEHLVAGGDAAVRGAAERGLERAGCRPRPSAARTACTPMSVTVRSVEPAERMDADAGDLDRRVTVRTPT